MSKLALSFIASTLLLVLLGDFALAGNSYQQGLQQYKLKNYKKAAQLFSEASQQEPTKQIYHYLLANCLVKTEQHQRAAEEYKLAYMLDASTSTGEFSRQALLAYKKKLPSQDLWKNVAEGEESSSELGRVKKHIQKQASFEKDKHDLMATRKEQVIKTQIDEQLKAIDQQMQADIQKLHDPIVYHPGFAPQANRLLALPELLKEKEEQIRTQAAAEKERVIREANGRAFGLEAWRKDRSALLDEAADNLQTQLDQPVGRSGVKLQTHGTDLYVRYYGKVPANKYPDAHQATVRIQEASSQPSSTDPIDKAAEPEKARVLAPVQAEVKGRVIKTPYFVNTLAGK